MAELTELQKQLFELQDIKYRDFHSKLMPETAKEKIIGIRTPVLRNFAKVFAGTPELEDFLQQLPHQFYEENNLHMMLITGIKDYPKCMEEVQRFLPYIDNWATCDFPEPKCFRKNKKAVLEEVRKWIASTETYTIRYGIGMLMRLFLDEDFSPEYLEMTAGVQSQEYYVNMIHNTDNFIANLIDAVNRRGEDTIIVMFGDHLPTMGLEDSDMKSGDIFKTKYATWNNFGLPKQDADLTAYQLLAHITGQMGIHEGTMFTYTQTQADSSTYQNGLDNLQYDLLYGERYAYNGEDLYPATDLVMDVEDVNVTSVRKNVLNNTLAVYGSNFTKNAKIFVNGEKVPTTYLTSGILTTSLDNVSDGDVISVSITGSQGIILRASTDEVVYEDPDVITTETEEPTEVNETESSETENSEATNTQENN